MECSGTRDFMPNPKLKNISEPICVKVENFNKTDGNRFLIRVLMTHKLYIMYMTICL